MSISPKADENTKNHMKPVDVLTAAPDQLPLEHPWDLTDRKQEDYNEPEILAFSNTKYLGWCCSTHESAVRTWRLFLIALAASPCLLRPLCP